jgi:hypothetical protein
MLAEGLRVPRPPRAARTRSEFEHGEPPSEGPNGLPPDSPPLRSQISRNVSCSAVSTNLQTPPEFGWPGMRIRDRCFAQCGQLFTPSGKPGSLDPQFHRLKRTEADLIMEATIVEARNVGKVQVRLKHGNLLLQKHIFLSCNSKHLH